jgi:hypothetical protein
MPDFLGTTRRFKASRSSIHSTERSLQSDGLSCQLQNLLTQLTEHYGEGALSQSQVYDWIRQVKLGRTDLAKIVSSGRAVHGRARQGPDESLAIAIANRIESDSRLSALKRACSMGITVSMVSHYVADVQDIKGCHLRLVPDTLTI